MSLAIRTLRSAIAKEYGAVRSKCSCANYVANEERQIVRELSRFRHHRGHDLATARMLGERKRRARSLQSGLPFLECRQINCETARKGMEDGDGEGHGDSFVGGGN